MINKEIIGLFSTTVVLQGNPVELILDISEQNNNLQVSISLPVLQLTNLLGQNIVFSPQSLNFELAELQMKFDFVVDGEIIQGYFWQGLDKFACTLERKKNNLVGNPDLVSSVEELEQLTSFDKGNYKYKVQDYFERPKSSGFQLSPDGTYLSYREKDSNNKRHVYVKQISTGIITRVIEETKELIRGYGWINNDRLVYVMDQGGDENYHLYGVDVDGGNNIDLTPFENVKAGILNMLKEQKDYIIISMNLDNAQVFEPYKINIHSGEYSKLFSNQDPENPVSDYDFDKSGNLKGYTKMVNGIQSQYYYKLEQASEFELVNTTNWYDTFGILSFDYANDNPDVAYVLTNLDSDKQRIVLYDFASRRIVKEIFSHPYYDASIIGLSRKRNWEIDYLGFHGEKVEITAVSEYFKQIDLDLKLAFGNYEYSIAGKTDLEDRYLVIVQSDKLYGKYYQYDAVTRQITLLYDLMPQLKENDMAIMKPISFQSRDGVTIHGYITLPQDALQGKGVPLIVNPHGGPQGVRDSWGFNPEAQLFASRGYATLAVNFRISGGYGKKFFKSGFKQVGRKVMDDIEDGVAYVLEQGWVDKNKIAIYGASHGGYATLMGLIKTPNLYCCGVDYVGVSSIFTFFDSFPEYWKPYKEMVKQIWYDLDDPKERQIAKEVSPIYHIDKIEKPLFVVQGANDPRVKIAESDQIVEALRARGVAVPYMVKYDEGHGFAKEENSIDFYRCMLGFFAKHL